MKITAVKMGFELSWQTCKLAVLYFYSTSMIVNSFEL
jgi:hypothetical protein